MIARHHLDVDAHGAGRRDGLGAVVARRIEERQQAEKPPFARFIGARHAQGAIALCGILVDQRGDRLALFGVRRAKIDDDLRRALGHLEALAVLLDLRLGPLRHRIEGLERAHHVSIETYA